MFEILTLEQLRARSGKTMQEVAEVLGVTKQAYWRKEKGLRLLKLQEADKLAHLFGIPVEEVISSARKVTKSVNTNSGNTVSSASA